MMYAQVPSCPTLTDKKRRELAHRLFRLGALNFNGVRLKTGELTPVYFDIRLSMSDPVLLQELAKHMYEMIRHVTAHEFDLVTGVPAAAVALATSLSIQNELPMILTRKAAKDYGTKKLIEGIWSPGQEVLVVEDVVTYGDSIAETTGVLRSSGLVVNHAVVVVERQQGATQNLLRNHKVQLHALLTFDDILNVLHADGLVSTERVCIARNFIAGAQFNRPKAVPKEPTIFCPALLPRLCDVLLAKPNKCLSIDTPMSCDQVLQVARSEGGSIAALEIFPSLVYDDSFSFASEIVKVAKDNNFFLIANCKLLGDEYIARSELAEGSHLSPSKWADIVTVCPLSSSGVFDALRKLSKISYGRKLGALLIADAVENDSSKDTSLDDRCMEMAEKNSDVVLGFVASAPLNSVIMRTNAQGDVLPTLIYKIPGVRSHVCKETKDSLTNGHSNGHSDALDCNLTKFNNLSAGLLHTIYFSSLKMEAI
ncbi:hypothetical protein Aperf_G00000025739 [Anoplocephala perfoliata]